MDRIDEMSVRELLEYALNFVHEQSVVVYFSHRHYSHDVFQAFSGDKFYLVDQTTPTKERIDAVVKMVQKSTPSAKVANAPGEGKHKGGGQDGDGKKNGREKSSTNSSKSSSGCCFPRFFSPGFGGDFGQGGMPGGVLGGGAGPIRFTCGLLGHIAANGSKK